MNHWQIARSEFEDCDCVCCDPPTSPDDPRVWNSESWPETCMKTEDDFERLARTAADTEGHFWGPEWLFDALVAKPHLTSTS